MKSWQTSQPISFQLNNLSIDNLPPQEVRDFLSELYTLKGLPFQYLVPDERMLPMESIRFFVLDPNWLSSLGDGALSIGRHTGLDHSVDQALLPLFHNTGTKGMSSIRYHKMHESHRRGQPTPIAQDEPLSGFLLRSELVGHWKGIEVRGNSGSQDLTIIRMEPLSDRILLCIFCGIVKKLEFYEPAEALRFGTKDHTHRLRVRKVTGTVGETAGEIIIPVDEETRRIHITDFVSRVKSVLPKEEGAEAAISSAELALQLICIADKCEITSKNSPIQPTRSSPAEHGTETKKEG